MIVQLSHMTDINKDPFVDDHSSHVDLTMALFVNLDGFEGPQTC